MGGIPDYLYYVLSCYVAEPAGLWSSFAVAPPPSYVAISFLL